MIHSFFGGVYPVTRKESTRRKPLVRLDPPDQVFIPLVMDAGATTVPLLRPGQRVMVGQPIAQSAQSLVHSSVSGRIASVEEYPHPWGGSSAAIIIDNDGQNTPFPRQPKPLKAAQVTLEILLNRVEGAGIVGMGGAAYPTAKKIRQAAGKIDTLIINGAECEPYITADYRLLLEHSEQILVASQVLAHTLGAKRAVVVTEGDKINAVELAERRLRNYNGPVELCAVRTRYPLGAEKQIVQTITGRETPPGGHALDVGCAVFNVATVFAIYEALMKGKPLTHRAVTVAGGAVSRPRNLWVPIGTPLRCLLEAAGGLRDEPSVIVTGGPMMGVVQQRLDAPVVKNTNSLICLAGWECQGQQRESICIRCGKCVAACPMHLAPALVTRTLQQGAVSELEKFHVEDCMECGSCTYICPARIPLVDLMRQVKDQVRKEGVG